MERPDYIPANYDRIKVVGSMDELLRTEFGNANVILFPRTLSADFEALGRFLEKQRSKHVPIKASLTMMFNQAASQVKDDIAAYKNEMRRRSNAKNYDLRVSSYNNWRGEVGVERFHADGCGDPAFGRLLSCYSGPVTEWIRNDEAYAVAEYGGATFFPNSGARIYSFKNGDIWRQRSPVNYCLAEHLEANNPFIHRTPQGVRDQKQDGAPRMLLVAG